MNTETAEYVDEDGRKCRVRKELGRGIVAEVLTEVWVGGAVGPGWQPTDPAAAEALERLKGDWVEWEEEGARYRGTPLGETVEFFSGVFQQWKPSSRGPTFRAGLAQGQKVGRELAEKVLAWFAPYQTLHSEDAQSIVSLAGQVRDGR